MSKMLQMFSFENGKQEELRQEIFEFEDNKETQDAYFEVLLFISRLIISKCRSKCLSVESTPFIC